VLARIRDWANFVTGRLSVETNLVSHDDRVGVPARRQYDDTIRRITE
jgi:hypothetical protein